MVSKEIPAAAHSYSQIDQHHRTGSVCSPRGAGLEKFPGFRYRDERGLCDGRGDGNFLGWGAGQWPIWTELDWVELQNNFQFTGNSYSVFIEHG